MLDEDDPQQRAPELDSDTTAFIADTCCASLPPERNSQLCVLSSGLDLEGVAARLIESQRRHANDRLFLVVLPDGVEVGTTTEIAATLTTQLALLARTHARPRLATSGGPPAVHAMEEGTAVKDRCLAYQHGGVVVIASRMLCADMLHRRLSLSLVGMVVVLVPFRITRHGSTARRSDAITPSLAFCVELFLRSRGSSAVAGSAMSPAQPEGTAQDSSLPRRAVVILSDNPSLMQYLVQRHQIGSERFIQQMRIGDIQLFPRFRLNLVQHFEKLAKEKPLQVDRIVVNVATSVLILDDLLQKILREVLSEVQLMEARLRDAATMSAATLALPASFTEPGSHGLDGEPGAGSDASRRRPQRENREDDGIPQAFQPRARLQHETVNGKLDYSSFDKFNAGRPSASSGSSASSPRAKTEDYIRRPWRAPGAAAEHRLLFSAITDEVLLDMEATDLDADVSAAHDVHDAEWPYRTLTESLLDVRWLRRALWSGTCYDFVFALERCLERRQRRAVQQLGAAAPPAALWTLSSHFHDLVTVATHRIGDIALVNGDVSGTDAKAPSDRGGRETAVVVDDDEDEDEVEVSIVGARGPPAYQIVPSSEEQDYAMEVAVRLAKSWCRDVVRKLNKARDDARTAPPALLLVTDGSRNMVRLMERLLYSTETVRRMELNSFLRRYQHNCGVHLDDGRRTTAGVNPLPTTVSPRRTDQQASASGGAEEQPASNTAQTHQPGESNEALLKQWLHLKQEPSIDLDNGSAALSPTPSSATASDDDDNNSDANNGMEAATNAGRHQDTAIGTTPGSSRAAMQAEIGSVLFGSQPPTLPKNQPSVGGRAATSTTTTNTTTAAPPVSLHHLLLTQPPQLVVSTLTSALATKAGEVHAFSLERIQKGVAVLVPQMALAAHGGDENPVDRLPRVVVADAAQLTVTDLMSFFTGSHRALRSSFFTDEDGVEKPAVDDAEMVDGSEPGTSHWCGGDARSSFAVQRVAVLNPGLTILRQLEVCQDDLPVATLQGFRVQLITSTFTEAAAKKMLGRERQSFASLAHVKATLTGTLLMDHASLRDTEAMLEDGLLIGNKRRRVSRAYAVIGGQHVRMEARLVQPPMVVFDEREFRSSLPYSLYARGIDLVPLTLTTADYILSPDYAVERKSVRDFTQSLTSGRIYHQLAALSRRYAHPLCLVEFSRSAPFRLAYASVCKTSTERGALTLMYSRVARVVTSYPRVSWIWSRSPAHSAAIFAELKRGVADENVDPSDPALTSGAANWAELGGTASPGEASSYAGRVLSRFPGITPQNAPKVMQLCGSLAGLATVSKLSLVNAIGEADGEALYAFLHTPFDAPVRV